MISLARCSWGNGTRGFDFASVALCPKLGHAVSFDPEPVPGFPQVTPEFEVAGRPHAGGEERFGAWTGLSSSASRSATPAAGGFHDGGDDWRNRRWI